MGRIERAFEQQYRSWLAALGARRPARLAEWLVRRIVKRARTRSISQTEALANMAGMLLERYGRTQQCRPLKETIPPTFWCDAGLGGLARWLRAAGYYARWQPDIDDAQLLGRAAEAHAVVLSTDSLLLERRAVISGAVQVLWLPPACGVGVQLHLVLRRWNLALREPLCMNCSGALDRVDKEAVRSRIPPRTYRWLDEYYRCRDCGQLFWRGTHWQRIRGELERLQAPGPLKAKP